MLKQNFLLALTAQMKKKKKKSYNLTMKMLLSSSFFHSLLSLKHRTFTQGESVKGNLWVRYIHTQQQLRNATQRMSTTSYLAPSQRSCHFWLLCKFPTQLKSYSVLLVISDSMPVFTKSKSQFSNLHSTVYLYRCRLFTFFGKSTF